jgi:hypothetical protein
MEGSRAPRGLPIHERMAKRLAVLLATVALGGVLSAPAGAGKGTSPACAVMGTLLAVGVVVQAHEEHQQPAPISKLRTGWPKMLAAARSAAPKLDRSTPVKRRLADRFALLVTGLERAGVALQSSDMDRFWTSLAQTKPDVLAVSSLAKQANLACTSTDGHGTLTITSP